MRRSLVTYTIVLLLTAVLCPAFNTPACGSSTAHHTFFSRLSAWVHQPGTQQIDSLKYFIESYPDYQPAYLKLEEQLLTVEQIEEIKKHFRRFNPKSPEYAHAQWILARYYTYTEAPGQALACYENALSQKFENYPALFDYQSVIQSEQKWSRAQHFLQQLLLSDTFYTIATANELLLKNRYEQAITLFESVNPSFDLRVYLQYYRSLYRYGDIHAALEIAQDGQMRAYNMGDFYYADLFSLAALKCEFWLSNGKSVKEKLADLQRSLNRTNNVILRAHVTKFQADMADFEKDYSTAIQYNKDALVGFLKFYDFRRATRTYQDLAELYYLNNQNVPALHTLNESIALATKLDNFELLAWAWRQYGTIYRDLGLFELSDKFLHRAQKAASQSENIYLAPNIDAAIQELRAKQLPPSQAVELYKAWLADLEKNKFVTDIFFPTLSLAQSLAALGDYSAAAVYYSQARDLARANGNKLEQAWANVGLADLALQRADTTQAFAQLHQALDTAHAHEKFKLVALIHFKLGQFYESQNALNTAIQHYHRAITQYEHERNELKAGELAIGFLSQRQETYERLAECYYKKYINDQNDAHLAAIYTIEELMHARTLKDEINHNAHRQEDKADDSLETLAKEFQLVQRQLRAYWQDSSKTDIDSLLATLQLYKYEIVNAKIRRGNMGPVRRAETLLPQLQDLQKRLLNQSALLYHISERCSFVLVIQSDTCRIVPLSISSTEMNRRITDLMHSLHKVDTNSAIDLAFKAEQSFHLYQKLFEPIEKQCRLTSQILVIPHGSLAHMPFDMMLNEKPRRTSYTPRDYPDYAEHFLSRKYDFYYNPSTHVLLREPLSCSPGMLIVADPFQGMHDKVDDAFTLRLRTGWQFSPLPFAHREASAIQRLCRNSTLIKGARATEHRLSTLAPRYSILHIASHAFVDTTFDIFSGLVLAEDHNSDGLLMGFEIANSRFPCNLVSLSACETGRGTLINGEGVLGLPRQFLASGARSVIMSKWKVDDQFAAEFMPRFYKYFLRHGLSKAAALNRAKRDVLDNIEDETDVHYQHPFFWAAFNLYGDAGDASEGQALVRQASINYIFKWAIFLVVGFLIVMIFIIRRQFLAARR